MRNFAGIPEDNADYEKSQILLQSIPYDGTSTWGKGADKAFSAFIEASENMELYDIETDSEVYLKGICTLKELAVESTPEQMFRSIYAKTKNLLLTNKFLTFFGGEHSISIGVIKAYAEKYSNLSVLHLDAHADLRDSYDGSEYNHACALHYASKHTNLVQVGIRSMDECEKQYMDYAKCFFAHDMYYENSWMDKSINLLGDNVYISLDLDVLDPSIMPSTGTPEPGGMSWYTILEYLAKVFALKNVVGFDIVELAPIGNQKAPDFLCAKLYYKMLSYKFNENVR